jgi:hypothetical protein
MVEGSQIRRREDSINSITSGKRRKRRKGFESMAHEEALSFDEDMTGRVEMEDTSSASTKEIDEQEDRGELWKVMLASGIILLAVGIPLFINILLLPRSEIPDSIVPAFVYFLMVFSGILLVYRSLEFTRHPHTSIIGKRIEILIREIRIPVFGNSKRIVGVVQKEIGDVRGVRYWIIRLRPRKGQTRFIAIRYAGETVPKGILRRMPRVVVEIGIMKDSSLMEKEVFDSGVFQNVAVGEIVVISQW